MSPQRVFALLGRRDEPTDAVEEYCKNLGAALSPHDFAMQIRRVPWELHGWPHSLNALKLQASSWRDTWVLVQYTALAWSERGFPLRFLQALRILAAPHARIAVVFHDVEPYGGSRMVDRIRRMAQLHTMRRALDLADLAIFTVAPENVSWLPPQNTQLAKRILLPVGPNLPIPEGRVIHVAGAIPAIAVFSITGGAAGEQETREIVSAVRSVSQKIGKLRVAVFGREAEQREATLRDGLMGLPVELSVEGVLDDTQVVDRLSSCDVLLFVRGAVSSRRSSAIAGIACGLPVIAYSSGETAPPTTEAGVVLIPVDQNLDTRQQQINSTLLRVLSDTDYRKELAARSRSAYEHHFSWNAIAAALAPHLRES